MALDFNSPKGYLALAIVLGVILLAAQMFAFPLGVVLTNIFIAAIVVLMIVWALKMFEIM